MRNAKPTLLSSCGIALGAVATVLLAPSGTMHAALDEANRAPLHTFGPRTAPARPARRVFAGPIPA